jgi:hypothetical protein
MGVTTRREPLTTVRDAGGPFRWPGLACRTTDASRGPATRNSVTESDHVLVLRGVPHVTDRPTATQATSATLGPADCAAETEDSSRPVSLADVAEVNRSQGNHTRVQGYGIPSIPRRCAECGSALTLVYFADGGTLWSGCPNDPGLTGS